MMNKKILLTIVAGLVLLTVILTGLFFYRNNKKWDHLTTSTSPPATSAVSSIADFDSNYFEKNKAKYIVRVIPFAASTTEGAELTVYFEKTDGSTKIMTASYGGETYHQQYTYYFKDIDNFLLIERFQKWDRSYGIDGRVELVDEINKYYFKNVAMTEWLNTEGKIVDPQSEQFKEKEKEMLEQVDRLLQLVSKK